LKYIILLSLLLFLPNVYYCQPSDNNPKQEKTNLEIFEENILTQLQKYIYYPGIDRDFIFVFTVNSMQGGGNVKRGEIETRFMNNIIKKFGESNKLKFSFINNPSELKLDSNYNIVLLQVYNLETVYPGFKKNKFLGEKTLTRSIKIKIGIEITSSDRKFNLKDFIYSDYKDEIGYDEYKKLESPPYEFTMGKVPDTGMFERIIFPIVLITASAAVIVLFFAIRTK
jgi:hypothetical protein